MSAKKATVLTAAMTSARRPDPPTPGPCPPRGGPSPGESPGVPGITPAARGQRGSLLEHRRAGVLRHPLLGDLVERAALLEGSDRLVHAIGQRAVLFEHAAEMLLLVAGGRELPDDHAVLHLDGGHKERGREVDHDPIHLARV